MKVQCISNSGMDLPKDCMKADCGFTQETLFALIPGRIYVVYAFTVFLGYVWYYICDENYTHYPVWNPSPLFKVSDHRLSSFWEFNCHAGSSVDETQVIVAFPEWARDPLYYDRLTNREDEAVRIFERYKRLIDEESAGT